MIIVLKPSTTDEELKEIEKKVNEWGLKLHVSKGTDRTILGVIGGDAVMYQDALIGFPGVEKIMPIMQPFKLVGREIKPFDTVVKVGDTEIGGKKINVMAGPCAIENLDILLEIADTVKEAGATFLRGGAFKPRTSPYSFQGLEEEGLKYLAEAKERTGLNVITELMDPRDLELVHRYTDIIQIGARNMQNFRLLKEVGNQEKPVLLKRGMSSTINDLLMSAEYIASNGNENIILCERGIRTFENYTRNTLDLSAVPAAKELSHLPVVVDPSHGVGKWSLVMPMAKAALAAGADGLMIEVHPRPQEAFSDGPQSLKPKVFARMMEELKEIASAVGREL